MSSIFDIKDRIRRNGSLSLSKNLKPLKEVERYLWKKSKELGFNISYDVTSYENPYFLTINYGVFYGSLFICPLQPEITFQQMYEAYYTSDEGQSTKYTDYFKSKAQNCEYSKYNLTEQVELNPGYSLVVLPGSNILGDVISIEKLCRVIEEEDNIYLKPHPLTGDAILESLSKKLPSVNFINKNISSHQVILNSKKLYSTHSSDSVFCASVLDIPTEPVDRADQRFKQAFVPINYFLFGNKDSKTWINKTFSSYKSGLVNPSIDSDWKTKINKYLDYILSKRDSYKGHYDTPYFNAFDRKVK